MGYYILGYYILGYYIKKNRRRGSDSGNGWSDWEELHSRKSSESEEERSRKRVKSEVRKVSYRRHGRADSRGRRRSKEREKGEKDVIERHRNKVLIFRKGRKWEDEASVTEWLQSRRTHRYLNYDAKEKTRGRRYEEQRINGRRIE